MQYLKILSSLMCAFMFIVTGCGNTNSDKKNPIGQVYLSINDAADREVILETKPQRIVSLSPSQLSMIEAVGGTIVGRATSKVGSIPVSMQNVPEVGLVYNVNIETLFSLKPDLVLAGKNQHEKYVPLLESNKIKVIELDNKTFTDVKKTIKMLGEIYGTEDKADAENALLDKQIADIKSKVPQEKKRIVIMHATASSVTVEGSRSIAGCVSDLLGFENVAAKYLKRGNEKTPYSMESLVGQNPEIIFITSMGKSDEIENRLRTDFKNNPAWNSLNAVQKGHVYVLPENLFLLNPGLKYPEAVKYMAEQVYPEVFVDEK